MLAAIPAKAGLALGASPKHRLCQNCAMPGLAVALPRSGMVFSSGPLSSTGSLWYLVDFDSGEANRITARDERDADSRHLTVAERTSRVMPAAELSRLKQIVREAWTQEDPLPARPTTVVGWRLWLLDGDDVRYEFARGSPIGVVRDIELMMARVLGEPVPVSIIPTNKLRFASPAE